MVTPDLSVGFGTKIMVIQYLYWSKDYTIPNATGGTIFEYEIYIFV